MSQTAASINQEAGWQASLDLAYANKNGKTCLVKKQHKGPLMVQKPFYPEAEHCCHTYLIHPPGGIAGGDQLQINSHLQDATHALITPPAATKFYRSIGPQAQQQQTLHVEDNAILEWLPQETVYFCAANVLNKTIIHMKESSSLMAWEIQCLGLTAQQQHFEHGQCLQRLEVWQDGRPLMLEMNRFIGGDDFLHSACGMHNHKTLATFIIKDPHQYLDGAMLDSFKPTQDVMVTACTYVNGLYIIRALGKYAEDIKNYFIQIWQHVRPIMLNLDPCSPRIWMT
ncbi:MAG: hypothetical protein CBC79_00760 [Gammaproteobacteria bacterium TMED119]|nr:MAG: hypothetical protein CBC79_00760 [Gammaproteobacteria bacterium TMED119]